MNTIWDDNLDWLKMENMREFPITVNLNFPSKFQTEMYPNSLAMVGVQEHYNYLNYKFNKTIHSETA